MGACPPVTVGQFFCHDHVGVVKGFHIPTNPILNLVDVVYIRLTTCHCLYLVHLWSTSLNLVHVTSL